MKKFKEWFHNGGQESLEFFCYLFGYLIFFAFIWLLMSFIRHIPDFISEVVAHLVDLGGQLP